MPRIALREARSGDSTLEIDGRLVHSGHNPVREARRAMADVIRREPSALVLLGIGLGYHAAAVLAETGETRVLAFEPSREIAELAESHALEPHLSSNRLLLVRSIEQLRSELPRVAGSGFDLHELPVCSDPPEITAARETVRRFADRLDINRNTLRRFGRLWIRNLCRNIPRMSRSVGVGLLQNAVPEVPTLLLAAGPTLDTLLPSLPALAERTVVVAVDTAIHPAIDAGVEPDFAVVVDPQYWNSRHLDRLSPGTIRLVAEPSTHPSIYERFREPAFLCSSLFPLGSAFEQAIGRFGSLGAGGSVATTAWDLCRLLGSSEIHVAGLDLGFPGNRTHVRGSFFETLAVGLARRLSPAEGIIFRYTWGANPELVPASGGGSVLSDRRMAVYRNWFEGQLREGSPPTRVLTSGGALVSGIEAIDVEQLLELPPQRGGIHAVLQTMDGELERRLAPDGIRERERAVIATASEIRVGLQELHALSLRALEVLESTRESDASDSFQALATIDREIGNHREREIAGFLMQDVIARIENGFGSENTTEQILASKELYSALEAGTKFSIKELSAAL